MLVCLLCSQPSAAASCPYHALHLPSWRGQMGAADADHLHCCGAFLPMCLCRCGVNFGLPAGIIWMGQPEAADGCPNL